jgi:phosphatidylinositol kinase/protein kinase (PI-3  family)
MGMLNLQFQNMIDGLGIAGYEGVFLKVCEITLSVLRGHKEALMTVLETFIHDPLVEWTKTSKSSGGEVRNPQAQVLPTSHIRTDATAICTYLCTGKQTMSLF